MDTCPNRCSILHMWKLFAVLLLSVTPALAQENATAYEALRVVGTELGRGVVNHVVLITGEKGDPQPAKWKIILEDPDGGGVRELEVADGKIDSEHRPGRSVAGSAEGATIDTTHLNLDSSGAYEIAAHTAELSHANFATADYKLRTDERGEPTWIVTLLSRSVESGRHPPYRCNARHGEANRRNVCRRDDGRCGERLRQRRRKRAI